jgi:hypothetical protein
LQIRAEIRLLLLESAAVLLLSGSAFAEDGIRVQLVHGSPRERETAETLQRVLASANVRKYTFTREVRIEQRAMNHAFPVLTLNVLFANSPDELLSSFLHEQLHWWLRDHPQQMGDAVRQLHQMYPRVPVGLPESADTEESTYGHLVDCYLEIQADRALIGPERTAKVIKHKPWYTWIYKKEIDDEARIAALVTAEGLEIE